MIKDKIYNLAGNIRTAVAGCVDNVKSKVSGKIDAVRKIPVDMELVMSAIRKNDLFRDIPTENISKMLDAMEVVTTRADQVIIREGQEGDFYYILADGNAVVSRKIAGKSEQLAVLGKGSAFGEEALISNDPRSATVTMTSNGVLARLSKEAFDLVKEPLVNWLSPREAVQKVREGATWLDVRNKNDATSEQLAGSRAIPMSELRKRLGELDKATMYVAYCENGRISSTASFLMRQSGYNVVVVRGGLRRMKAVGNKT